MTVVLVIAGGAVGAVLRWRLAALNARWPAGTLVANVAGSFLLGLMVATTDDPGLLAGLGTGVLGGLTTFSTFALEVVTMDPHARTTYTTVSLVAGVGAALFGIALGGALAGSG